MSEKISGINASQDKFEMEEFFGEAEYFNGNRVSLDELEDNYGLLHSSCNTGPDDEIITRCENIIDQKITSQHQKLKSLSEEMKYTGDKRSLFLIPKGTYITGHDIYKKYKGCLNENIIVANDKKNHNIFEVIKSLSEYEDRAIVSYIDKHSQRKEATLPSHVKIEKIKGCHHTDVKDFDINAFLYLLANL